MHIRVTAANILLYLNGEASVIPLAAPVSPAEQALHGEQGGAERGLSALLQHPVPSASNPKSKSILSAFGWP